VRVRIDLAYDGAGFHGWARQPGLRTVQGELETALATLLRLDSVEVTCAGRTDAGVHARGQVVHVDVPRPLPDRLERRLNAVLADDVVVRAVTEAAAGFDARFSALWRRYAYRIADAAEAVDPLSRGHVLALRRPLDLDAMNTASAALVGEHDFAAFCRRREGATTVRTVLELRWERDAGGAAVGTVRADAFCHHMVRSMVGALVSVGDGRRSVGWMEELLAACVRDPAVTVLPAHGLTLEEVGYPPEADLAERARLSRAVRTMPTATR
jgi:tRNA pseudouridine38-40 synthase